MFYKQIHDMNLIIWNNNDSKDEAQKQKWYFQNLPETVAVAA